MRLNSIVEIMLIVFMAIFYLLPQNLTDIGFGFRLESLIPGAVIVLFIFFNRGVVSLGVESIWLAVFSMVLLTYFFIIDFSYVSAFKVIAWFCISLAFAICIRSRNFFYKFINFYVFFGVCAAFIYIISPSKWGVIEVNIFSFELRTVYCYFVAIACGLSFVKYSEFKSRKSFAAFTLCFAVLMISGARGPLLMTILIVFCIVVNSGKLQIRISAPFFVIIFVFFLATFQNQDFYIRYLSIIDLNEASSTLYRLDLLGAAVKSIAEFNIFGITESSYRDYLANNTTQFYGHIQSFDKFFADSDVVRLLIKHGILASLLLMGICYRWIKKTLSLSNHDRGYELVFLIAFVFMIFFDDILTNPAGWILLSVYLAQRPKVVS